MQRLTDSEDDVKAIYSCLTIVENLCEVEPSIILRIVKESDILEFLLKYIQKQGAICVLNAPHTQVHSCLA